nr:hypothetical protein [Ktedonobacterales bacterium]
MRWFWSRRKREHDSAPSTSTPIVSARRSGTLTLDRGVRRRDRQATHAHEPHDALLRFARDYLLALGGRVRLEEDDVVAATLPDGASARYTTTLARARAEVGTAYLAEGSAALATALEVCAEHARLIALALPSEADPATLALAACAEPAPGCGRCLDRDGEPGLRAVPSCAVCPLREGRLLLAGLAGARTAEVLRRWEAPSVELTFLVVGRGRQGRHDEWVRIAVESETGRRLGVLMPEQLARARTAPLADAPERLLAAALQVAEAELTPALEAMSLYLRQRTEDDYQQRVEETIATHKRLRHEEAEHAREVDAALERELSALAEVFAVEVEARLESACVITSPMAEVAIRTTGGAVTLLVDLGRGTVLPPICADCGAECQAGSVCARGHVACVACEQAGGSVGDRACGHCGPLRHSAEARRDLPATVSRAPANRSVLHTKRGVDVQGTSSVLT